MNVKCKSTICNRTLTESKHEQKKTLKYTIKNSTNCFFSIGWKSELKVRICKFKCEIWDRMLQGIKKGAWRLIFDKWLRHVIDAITLQISRNSHEERYNNGAEYITHMLSETGIRIARGNKYYWYHVSTSTKTLTFKRFKINHTRALVFCVTDDYKRD